MAAAVRSEHGRAERPNLHIVRSQPDDELFLSPTARDEADTTASQYRSVRSNLRYIGVKTGRRLVVPGRPLTPDEEGLILYARTVLERGEATQAWEWVDLPVNAQQAESILDDFSGGVVRSVRLSSETGEYFSLYGVSLPLGPTEFLLPQAKLVNEQEVRRQLAERDAQRTTFRLRLGTDAVTVAVFRYRDWLPEGRWQRGHEIPPRRTDGQNDRQIIREHPGPWLILTSTEVTSLSNILNAIVLAALKELDRDEYEKVLRLLPILMGGEGTWRTDWPLHKVPQSDTLYLFDISEHLQAILDLPSGTSGQILGFVRPELMRRS